ncbi:hypothetical protein GCM10010964_42820 [Caldovatus sediminis]|uniref:Uncharacterized protein n=1 Tax=Caldovatus sediminis TaxID=2041189 RepID=A0A8J3EF62_9PROT|nr:hypothetical protein [Caldovatus sediminis]GGG50992.1 hypothetical protein GCM10010964_42820 [Caldovatus sediminis]
MRGPRCTACFHSRVAEIDAALASGAPLIATAAKFGLSKSALARHRTRCLAPKLAAAAKMVAPASAIRAEVQRAKAIASGQAEAAPADVLTLQGLVGRLGRLLDRLEGASASAADDGLHASLAAVSGPLIKAVETAARLQGIGAQVDKPAAPTFSITFDLSGVEERQPARPVPVAQRPVGSVADAIPEDAQGIEAGESASDAGQADAGPLPVPGFDFAIRA